jgi:MOSC domain-containing protein YiiM
MAQVYSITIQPIQQDTPDSFDAFIRQPVQEANLIVGFGIEGDVKGGQNPKRQINLLSQEWVEEKEALGYVAFPGSFGEQMVLKGLDFSVLGPKSTLRLGDQAVIEITKARTGCKRLDIAQSKPMDEKYVGYLARVVAGGKVRIGDTVKILETV